jgi:hypothetical protein
VEGGGTSLEMTYAPWGDIPTIKGSSRIARFYVGGGGIESMVVDSEGTTREHSTKTNRGTAWMELKGELATPAPPPMPISPQEWKPALLGVRENIRQKNRQRVPNHGDGERWQMARGLLSNMDVDS